MFAIVIATVFLAGICALAVRDVLPPAVALVYLIASVAAVVAYGIDKSAAQTGAWRTSERTLHVLALIGGWPGALIAQRLFRHKSRKPSFQLVFWTTAAINCVVLVWLWWAQRQ